MRAGDWSARSGCRTGLVDAKNWREERAFVRRLVIGRREMAFCKRIGDWSGGVAVVVEVLSGKCWRLEGRKGGRLIQMDGESTVHGGRDEEHRDKLKQQTRSSDKGGMPERK